MRNKSFWLKKMLSEIVTILYVLENVAIILLLRPYLHKVSVHHRRIMHIMRYLKTEHGYESGNAEFEKQYK
jgi:hypothetical protein